MGRHSRLLREKSQHPGYQRGEECHHAGDEIAVELSGVEHLAQAQTHHCSKRGIDCSDEVAAKEEAEAAAGRTAAKHREQRRVAALPAFNEFEFFLAAFHGVFFVDSFERQVAHVVDYCHVHSLALAWAKQRDGVVVFCVEAKPQLVEIGEDVHLLCWQPQMVGHAHHVALYAARVSHALHKQAPRVEG